MIIRLPLFAALAFLATAAFSFAQAQQKIKETCAEQSGQFSNTRTCVSSELAPQGENKYGPQSLIDGEGKAWCEGVTGYGIGETITIHYKPAVRLQKFSFINGYPKTPETFKNNSRVKQLRVQTSDGVAAVVTLQDIAEDQPIKLPRIAKPVWVRFTILEVYPGARGSDTCVGGIFSNLEELNN